MSDSVHSSIQVTVTPGKPGATSETVTVVRSDARCTLRVVRTDTFGKTVGEESVDLDPTEFTALWSIVKRNQLQSFKPQEEPGRVFDFGERRIRIETKPNQHSKLQVHEVCWQRPLENKNRLVPLMSRLAKLAHDRAKGVPLHYFPQPQ